MKQSKKYWEKAWEKLSRTTKVYYSKTMMTKEKWVKMKLQKNL